MSKIHFQWGNKDAEWYCIIPFVQQKEGRRYRIDGYEFVYTYTYICIDVFWNEAQETGLSCYLGD